VLARPAGSNLPNPDPVVARSVAMGALFGSAVLARAGASFRGDAARSRINGALPGSAVFARPAGSAIAAAETVSNAAVRGIGGFMTSSFLLRGQQSVPMDVPCQHVSNAGLSRRNSYRIYSPSPARSRASTVMRFGGSGERACGSGLIPDAPEPPRTRPARWAGCLLLKGMAPTTWWCRSTGCFGCRAVLRRYSARDQNPERVSCPTSSTTFSVSATPSSM
jgi:hypothetical protein